MSREIEKLSASACDWRSGNLNVAPDQLWQLSSSSSGEQEGNLVACTYLDDGVSLRLSPMEQRQRGGGAIRWKDANFHSKLQVPTTNNNNQDGLVLLFQAKARESIAIALSPTADSSSSQKYEIQLGAVGNTATTIQRRGVPQSQKGPQVSIPSRVCHDKAWIPYWVCMWEGKVHVGVGHEPGQECIGVLDDSEYCKTPQPPPQEEEGDKEDTKKEPIQYYVGFGNMAKGGHHHNPLMIQKVRLTNIVPPMLAETLASLPDDLPIVVVNNGGGDDNDNNDNDEVKRLMEEYKQECRVRKARAEKFGTGYKEPAPDAFLPWSQAKRLRENPEKGFITGLDLMDPAELAKQEARKARFGVMATDDGGGDTKEETAPADADAEMDTSSTPKGLPVIQTWDKEEMLRPQRNDPPESLWKQPPAEATPQVIDEFAMEQPKPVTLVPEKLHLFAIDWAAFKQIRNKDIMSYFSIYGPSYVEWLADLSCNVCFEDKFTASRALHNLSQEIPSPPPPADDVQNDETEHNNDTRPDFGNMGWRFCLAPIRKVANDRFGRMNTTARVLMRPALSTDILDERPNTWPAPPGGFSSTRVLGPDSDLARGKQKKKKREHNQNQNQKDGAGSGHVKKAVVYTFDPAASGGDHPLLSQGLSAGRGGFSVEELEKERAQKRAKTADAKAD